MAFWPAADEGGRRIARNWTRWYSSSCDAKFAATGKNVLLFVVCQAHFGEFHSINFD